MAFDAKEDANSNANRKANGNNLYALSNLAQWLNTEGASWYEARHPADSPPSTEGVTYNAYDSAEGLLSHFSLAMKSSLMDTALTVARPIVDGGGSETVTQRVFLLSKAEAGLGAENSIAEGACLSLFNSGNASRVSYPTAEGAANSNYTNTALAASKPFFYWLRSPVASGANSARIVSTDGSEGTALANNGNYGLRIAINLPSNTYISDIPDPDGIYTLRLNLPPTMPSGITVPEHIQGGGAADITWGSSSSPQNNLAGYRLERSADDSAFVLIYQGSNRTYTDSVTHGWETVQYAICIPQTRS